MSDSEKKALFLTARFVVGILFSQVVCWACSIVVAWTYVVVEGSRSNQDGFVGVVTDSELIPFMAFVTAVSLTIALPVSAVSTFLIGVPLFLILRAAVLNSWVVYAVCGLVISALVWVVLKRLGIILFDEDGHYITAGIFAAGPMATLSFWLIVRPDRA